MLTLLEQRILEMSVRLFQWLHDFRYKMAYVNNINYKLDISSASF